MSGRGVWWEVRENAGVMMVMYIKGASHVEGGIDPAIAKMVHEGDVDAVAAMLECPDDVRFQNAVRAYKP